MKSKIYFFLLLICCLYGCHQSEQKGTKILLIGIDGLSTNGLQKARTPNINQLIKEGVSSLHARGVIQTFSGPNWGSMLMGASPEQHGITSNNWKTDNYTIEARVRDKEGYFPSIFELIKSQEPQVKTAIYHEWDVIADLVNPKHLDAIENTPEDGNVTFEKAIEFIDSKDAFFVFTHLGEVDHTGHGIGHETQAYYESIENVDRKIGILIQELKEKGIYDDTYIIISSDHGGIDKGHGGLSMKELEIPWIVKGPGVRKNVTVPDFVNTYDTPATIASLLGLEQPKIWMGKPIISILEINKDEYPASGQYLPMPRVNYQQESLDEKVSIKAIVDDAQATIHYTLDGSSPNNSSPVYNGVLIIEESGFHRLAFRSRKNEVWSDIETINFHVSDQMKKAEMTRPHKSYNGNGKNTLIDKQIASSDYRDKAWQGFEKVDFEGEFELKKEFNQIEVRFLKDYEVWIFPPREIELSYSMSGKKYSKTITKIIHTDPGEDKKEILSESFDIPAGHKFVKVKVKNRGMCPAWHPYAGNPSWLFLDEIKFTKD